MNSEDVITQTMIKMFAQLHAQMGHALKGYWFYESERCPSCGRKAGPMRYQGKDALSINAYIYQRRGILIGYLLCGRCANAIHQAAKRRPGQQTAEHDDIEHSLNIAYEAHLRRMDA